MCIAIYVPKGKVISKEHLKMSFVNNPDGAGFAVSFDNRVQIKKGFFEFDKFFEAYMEYAGQYDMLVHCRISTSGGVSASNCHPFPLKKSMDSLRKLSTTCDVAVVHNGVIKSCTPPKKAKYSDTMLFVTRYLTKLDWQDEDIQDVIEGFIGSKLAIMPAGGETILIGDWTEDGGIWYSNNTYKYKRYSNKSLVSTIIIMHAMTEPELDYLVKQIEKAYPYSRVVPRHHNTYSLLDVLPYYSNKVFDLVRSYGYKDTYQY